MFSLNNYITKKRKELLEQSYKDILNDKNLKLKFDTLKNNFLLSLSYDECIRKINDKDEFALILFCKN